MVSQAERTNFMRQCWRTGRWKAGVGTLLLPLRLSFYQLRRDVLRPRRRNGDIRVRIGNGAHDAMPAFSDRVYPIFCDIGSQDDSPPLHLDGLFAEVDAQLHGEYRLAGGRTGAVDAQSLETRGDVEDVHAYHRLYWALRYAEAAAFGHESAPEVLLRDLSQWLNGRSKDSAAALWPYTVAERIGSLTAASFWIRRSGAPEISSLIVAIKRQLWKDAIQLASNVEYGLGLHNHLLNDARGLFLAGAALADCEQAAEWRERAFAIWDEFFPQLVLEDGTFAEQSSHYHLLLCRTALEYWLACRRDHRSLPAGFESRIHSMFRLANQLLRPDGSLPRFGDNSPDRTISDLWGLLAAAYHYGLLQEPPRHTAVTPLTIFYCGLCPHVPEPQGTVGVQLFPQGGFAILRSTTLGAELVAHGDCRDGVGPHGDAGRGSYELWWNGHVLVCEPGSFFSSSDAKWHFYHCAEAQNVTSLDGLSPAITKQNERFLAPWYCPQGGVWKTLPGVAAEFRCEAFRRLHPDIVLSRTWRFEEPDTLLFDERIEGSTRVRFDSRVCLGNAAWGSLQHDEKSGFGKLEWQGADGSSASMTIAAPRNISMAIRGGTFLPEYGVEKEGRVLVLAGTQQLPCSWTVRWKFRKAS